jgi:hypothetical protein
MQTQLAQSHFGRVLLHLACACIDHKYAWHWQGACRELAAPFHPRRAPKPVQAAARGR